MLELPAWGGIAELLLKSVVGGLVYAAAALAMDVAGVRAQALALGRARFGARAAA